MKARIAALALLACLAFAPSAQALYDPLGSGSVTLTLDKGFASYLQQNGIELAAGAPAKRQGAKLTLPVAGGKWDPTQGKGTAEAAGAIVFQSERRKLPFKDVVVKAKRTPLIAKVGGGQLKVASAKSLKPTRFGFGAKLAASQLALTAKAATRLNKKLRPQTPFAAGQLLGTLSAKVAPRSVAILPQARATLAPDPAFLAKLEALHVSLNPVAPAELAPGPLLSLPIASEGAIASDASGGTLKTAGELEFLQLGAGQVFWAQQALDLSAGLDLAEPNIQPAPPFAGKQGQLGILTLGRGTVSSDSKARTIAVSGAPLALSAASAAAFNEAFAEGRAVFGAGEAFGSVSFTAQGQ